MKETMKILVVEPSKRPYVKEINHTLEEMQKVVGGSIQAIYPFEDRVGLICNGEAKIAGGFSPNRPLRDEDGNIYDIIYGTFLIAGLGEEDFCSLDDELIEKFRSFYKTPELFNYQCLSDEEQEWIIENHPPIQTFQLWMLKDTEENKEYLFMAHRFLKKSGRKIKRADDEEVYDGICLGENNLESAESIYAYLNTHKPEDYHARTFSMGDIIVLSDEDRNEKAYFCDTFGFVEVPEFLS